MLSIWGTKNILGSLKVSKCIPVHKKLI